MMTDRQKTERNKARARIKSKKAMERAIAKLNPNDDLEKRMGTLIQRQEATMAPTQRRAIRYKSDAEKRRAFTARRLLKTAHKINAAYLGNNFLNATECGVEWSESLNIVYVNSKVTCKTCLRKMNVTI